MKLPAYITNAIKSGPVPKVRNWRKFVKTKPHKLTRAEMIMAFAEMYLVVPEGSKVGEPLKLELFQEVFLYAVFDNPDGTDLAVLSMGRKNGKTALCAIILLAFIAGPEAVKNSQVSSGAMSRDQAALVFNHMAKFVAANPELEEKIHVRLSGKHLTGLVENVQYQALAKDSNTAVGRSDRLIVGDEWGRIVGAVDAFVDALTTSQGAFDDPLIICISTQAASDGDYLSLIIDDAERAGEKTTVCHVYAAAEDCELDDKRQWKLANPALDVFRSRRDIESQLKKAARLPALESGARNLLLNQRVSLEKIWLAPAVWKENRQAPDIDVFRTNPVSLGVDLSARHDLTAAVAAAADPDGVVHLLPFIFTPARGLRERVLRDRAPYDTWAKQKKMFALPGASIDYQLFAETLRDIFDDMDVVIDTIEFDRWRIDVFQKACEAAGFAPGAAWNPVGQGYKDQSPRLEVFQNLLLQEQIRHGGHPLLTMAASHAIAVKDPAGSIKLDKSKTTQRIDPIIAAVMAAYPVSEGVGIADDDVELWIA
jgi:phage terminase large subunit-like protein